MLPSIQEQLYGPVGMLQTTVQFIVEIWLRVWSVIEKKKRAMCHSKRGMIKNLPRWKPWALNTGLNFAALYLQIVNGERLHIKSETFLSGMLNSKYMYSISQSSFQCSLVQILKKEARNGF
jgi:hypothetical protein